MNLEFRLGLELELKLEWLDGVSKTLGWPVYVAPYLYGGQSPPYNYNAKYTSLPRVFDTPSSHSNFNSNSNPNLNSKFTKFQEIYPPCHLPYLSLKSTLERLVILAKGVEIVSVCSTFIFSLSFLFFIYFDCELQWTETIGLKRLAFWLFSILTSKKGRVNDR